MPLKAWIKDALDHVIQVCLGEPDLEFAWVGDDAVDPLQQAQTLNPGRRRIKTIGEARADLGLAAGRTSAPALGKYNPMLGDELGLFTDAAHAVELGGQARSRRRACRLRPRRREDEERRGRAGQPNSR